MDVTCPVYRRRVTFSNYYRSRVRQVHVQEHGGTEVDDDRAGDARAGQQIHVRGLGGRVHRVPDAQPDRGHGARRVPGGQAVRWPDGVAPRTGAAAAFAGRGPGHRAAVTGPDAGGGRGRARRGVRPDGPALRYAVGVLRRVH